MKKESTLGIYKTKSEVDMALKFIKMEIIILDNGTKTYITVKGNYQSLLKIIFMKVIG
jgi:thymidylate synthase ThyX